MFCTTCGSKLQDANEYCPECGAYNEYFKQSTAFNEPQQQIQAAVPEQAKKEKSPKKEKIHKPFNKKLLLVLIPVAIVLIIAIVLSIVLRPVEFKDEIVALAVHDALGKEPHEDIYIWELNDVEELYIDDSYTVGKYIIDAGGTHSFTPYMDIDMSEIARLKNLKELTIVNDRFDKIYCLSALADCKKLESLTMYYQTDHVPVNVYLGHGCKELLTVIEGCPKLEYINTISEVPMELKENAWELNDDIEFYTRDGLSAEDNYEATRPVLESTYKSVTSDGMVVIDYTEDPIELEDYLKEDDAVALKVGELSDEDWELITASDSVRALYISEDVDLEVIEGMDNLVSLTIAGYFAPDSFEWEIKKVENLDVLSSLENLTSLSLFACDIDGDVEDLDNIDNLKFLSYWQMENELPEDLKFFKDLIGFEYYSEDDEPDQYLEKMDNLTKLKLMFEDELDVSNLKNLRYLTLCPLLDDDLDMSMINKLKDLRSLYVYIWTNRYATDWSDFKGLDKLENIYCNAGLDEPENIAKCKNLTRVYLNLFMGHQDEEDYSNVKYDMSEIAELENLSYFGITKADVLMTDYNNFSGIKGLREMDDRDVFVNICAGRYSCNSKPRENYKRNIEYLN